MRDTIEAIGLILTVFNMMVATVNIPRDTGRGYFSALLGWSTVLVLQIRLIQLY